MEASARVTPGTFRISSSARKSSFIMSSSDTAKGSLSTGVCHRAVIFCSGARTTSFFFTRALARAMATAWAAAASMFSRPNWSVEANPQAPSAITRTPRPSDSLSMTLPTLPFLVESVR